MSQKPSEVTAVEVPPETTASVTATAPAATDTPEVPPQDDGLNMHKKITIKPLTENTEKKDINQLLAEEMAKANPAAGTSVLAPSTPQSMTPPTSDPNADDPNSVAL